MLFMFFKLLQDDLVRLYLGLGQFGVLRESLTCYDGVFFVLDFVLFNSFAHFNQFFLRSLFFLL